MNEMEERDAQGSVSLESAPFVVTLAEMPPGDPKQPAPHAGDPCPHCHAGQLDYDGMLNLACPACGYSLGGCFT